MHKLVRAAAVALLAIASSPALATPRTDCQPQAIRDLQRLSPQGHAIYSAMTDKKQFLFFLACDNVQLGLATAVHESVHMLTEKKDAYPLIAGGSVTLHRYVAGFGKRTGVKARLRIGQSPNALPFVLQRPVFRVIQEALANVYRHASASRVSVDLKYILGHLHVVVRDNGRGMQGARRSPDQPCEPSCLGVGIPGIRARLRQFGGKLVIKSGRRGTMLHAIVPIVTTPALEA